MLPRVLSTPRGLEVHILPLGATIQRLYVPDKSGKRADVALGFDNADDYKNATKVRVCGYPAETRCACA